ncbi:MAG: hypothetical protein UHS51_00235 [Atopobiaceae bacterium]|nr:hypothetical protein [Atopobiaceae bacterium]
MRMRRMKNLQPRMEACGSLRIEDPASYKGICLAVGGLTYPFASRNTTSKNYWSSTKTTYYQTQYFKKNQTNTHFMRIY